MQGRETPACPTAIHTAAEAAANQTIRMFRNPGATSPRSIPTKRRLLAIHGANRAAAINRNQLLPTMIRIGIRHNSNRNKVNTAGRRLTSRALSGLNDRMQSRVLEIRRSSSGARPTK